MIDYSELVSKIAADKNSKKLGKIIKIENVTESKKGIKKSTLYALILVQSFLKKDVVILVEVEKLIKTEGYYAWFDILKKDFDQEVRETRALL